MPSRAVSVIVTLTGVWMASTRLWTAWPPAAEVGPALPGGRARGPATAAGRRRPPRAIGLVGADHRLDAVALRRGVAVILRRRELDSDIALAGRRLRRRGLPSRGPQRRGGRERPRRAPRGGTASGERRPASTWRAAAAVDRCRRSGARRPAGVPGCSNHRTARSASTWLATSAGAAFSASRADSRASVTSASTSSWPAARRRQPASSWWWQRRRRPSQRGAARRNGRAGVRTPSTTVSTRAGSTTAWPHAERGRGGPGRRAPEPRVGQPGRLARRGPERRGAGPRCRGRSRWASSVGDAGGRERVGGGRRRRAGPARAGRPPPPAGRRPGRRRPAAVDAVERLEHLGADGQGRHHVGGGRDGGHERAGRGDRWLLSSVGVRGGAGRGLDLGEDRDVEGRGRRPRPAAAGSGR